MKLFGLWATLGGALIGGLLMVRLGIHRSSWAFGVLQAVSTLGFALLAGTGAVVPMLATVVFFENLSAGMGTAAYLAFMASLTDRRFTATQYALLTRLMGMPRVIAASPAGYAQEAIGWPMYSIGCALLAGPWLLLLRFRRWPAVGEATASLIRPDNW